MMDAMKSFFSSKSLEYMNFSSRNELFFVYSVSHVKIIDAKINYSCLHVIISCLYLGMCYLNSMFWSFEKQHARSVCLDVMFVLYPRQRLLACSKILRFLLFVISGRETNCPSPRSCAALWPNSCCEGEQSAVINHPRNSCLPRLQSFIVGYCSHLAAVAESWEQFSNRTAFCFLMFLCSSRKHAKTCVVVLEFACVLALTRVFASFPVLMRRPSLRKPSKKAWEKPSP